MSVSAVPAAFDGIIVDLVTDPRSNNGDMKPAALPPNTCEGILRKYRAFQSMLLNYSMNCSTS